MVDCFNVRNTKQNESAATIEKLWNGNHVINELPDDTSPDEIVDDGYYSVYTSIKGKRYRWILHNKAVVAAYSGILSHPNCLLLYGRRKRLQYSATTA